MTTRELNIGMFIMLFLAAFGIFYLPSASPYKSGVQLDTNATAVVQGITPTDTINMPNTHAVFIDEVMSAYSTDTGFHYHMKISYEKWKEWKKNPKGKSYQPPSFLRKWTKKN